MDIDHLQHGFTYLLLERVNLEKNENRFYYLAWQPTLFADETVVRSYGRRDGQRRTLSPLPYASLSEAWPVIRALIRRRLRHGYKMIEPKNLAAEVETETLGESALTHLAGGQAVPGGLRGDP